MNCNVCSHALNRKIYESESARALTSLCTAYDGTVQVYFCQTCGHVQSTEINDADAYYDNSYNILTESEEEDQIYEVTNGATIFRTEHQVRTLLAKVNLRAGAKILDYGCAKSSAMRALSARNPDLQIYLFDISDRYLPFWEKFLTDERWATYAAPAAWDGMIDVVTSFFSMEHMIRPQDALQQISRKLKPDGIFYGIVPNAFTNTADLVVVDHVNHFTEPSLTCLLQSNGFDVVEIDAAAHRGALVFKARKTGSPTPVARLPAPNVIREASVEADKIARFWEKFGSKIRNFEDANTSVERLAIYGAGFYGAFTAACLRHPEKIACMIDQNPYLHGRKLNGIPIVPPSGLPANISVVLVGMNPAHARKLVTEIPEFSNRQLSYFFL